MTNVLIMSQKQPNYLGTTLIYTLTLLIFTVNASAQNAGGTATVTIDEDEFQFYNAVEKENICDSTSSTELTLDLSDITIKPNALCDPMLYIWWQEGEDECERAIPTTDVLYDEKLDAQSSLIANSSLVIPDDLESNWPEIDKADILDELGACGSSDTELDNTITLCIGVDQNDGCSGLGVSGSRNDRIDDTEFRAWIHFGVDTLPPDAPSLSQVVALDGALNITIRAGDDDDTLSGWKVYYVAIQEDDGSESEASLPADCSTLKGLPDVAEKELGSGSSTETLSLSDLVNGQLYALCAAAIDRSENEGEGSNVLSATPINECDFGECFGDVKTGCTQSKASLIWLLLTSFIALALMRQRFWTAPHFKIPLLLLLFALTNAAFPAHAKITSFDNGFSAEVRIGPFRPNISSNKNQRKVFNAIHASGYDDALFEKTGPLLKSLEFQTYLWRFGGPLGVTFGAGHWNITGKSLRCPDSTLVCDATTLDPDTASAGNTPTNFLIIPTSLGLSYQWDWLYQTLNIPLVPQLRGGISEHFWWAKTAGKTAQLIKRDGLTKKDASGGTFGMYIRAGLAFGLDWLDSKPMNPRHSFGLSASYLFFDWTRTRSLGNSRRIQFDDDSYQAGFRFDFR